MFLRSLVPPPIRALPWRLPWVRSTDAYRQSPLRTWLRAARFTVWELAGRERALQTPDGVGFASMPNNFSSFALFVGGARDPLIWRFLQRRLRPGAIFVDAGANIGAYSLPVARLVGPTGRVVAFEAHPVTFGCLERGVAMNGLPQVTALNLALGDRPGQVSMAFNTKNPGETHVTTAGTGGAEVRLVTLDAALAELGITRIDYLKIDVEGFELPVLRGARGIIAASPGVTVQTELEDQHASRYGHSVREIEALLRELGLTPHGVDHEGRAYPFPDPELPREVIWIRAGTAAEGSAPA
ncbi:FkbM family methyltransferase [Roseomonas sp. BN140053]|uniref:FkbM family methyltransferase n=1 Tax=Roseomonas sp. BN140053 TaxID=3391898 RepID=UPI0039E805B1